ncbi:damage-inducible protein DinB [Limnohabitans sp. 2KL-17]|uniref:DinB family protein n=1 Tax=Limnohabitans sp. 2KL-17 TaxID=1100704 RepID=UPI000D3A80B4|nr:DinB family protein [Limnohabitans sp. 2KL-17]PUE51525.1 damage-inducible protein DinB [Limnohabitans sp. 2KL-17]
MAALKPLLSPFHTHFYQQARYHVWATHRLLDAVMPVADTDYFKNLGLFFKSIHGTLNHLLVAEHLLWYARFSKGASPLLGLDTEVEPNRERLAQALNGGSANWERLIATWPAERFDGQLDYRTMKGVPQLLPFAATLAHVFNHATHHRGQITAALTALGQPSPELDWVYHLQLEAAEAKKA